MLIQITNRCHMDCPHCMQDAKSDGRHMTDDTFGEVMRFAADARPLVVNITGGEPTEHPRWVEFTRQLLTLKSVAVATILTNGAWIDDSAQRMAMARLIREQRGRLKVQVYSNPRYYQDHEWTLEHESQYRSLGCTPDFESPIYMQDLGRARLNCRQEVEENFCSPSCINSHLMAVQCTSLQHFFLMCAQAGKFCRPLIDPDGAIHMSESWLCPAVAHVSDGPDAAFLKMQQSRPCKSCRLYKNFEHRHPTEARLLNT